MLHHYYELVRQRVRIGTRRLAVSAAWRTPSRTRPLAGERALYRRTLSHVSCSSRRSDSRRLYAGHRLANKRAPARLFPGLCTHPGFDAISYFSTLPQRFARARLPDPRLTALTPPFSSIAPHNGLQPMQHRGGLTPPPAGRRRRATNLHLLHNTASRRSTYTQPLSGVRGTRA
jgi:hypothetical protein